MIYLAWMGSTTTVEPPLVCVNRMEFFLEFEENDATNIFLDSAGNWDFTCRTTSALATTSSFSGSGSGLENRYGFPNSVEGNSIYIPVADGFKLPDANWTFGLWCKTITATGGTTRFLMGNVGATATDFQAYIAIDGVDNQYHFYCTTNGAVSGRTDLDSTHNPHATDWTLLAASLDRTNNQMVLRTRRVGGSTVKVTTAFTGSLYTGSTTANFCINDGLSSDSTYFSSNRAGVIAVEKAFYTLGEFTDADFDDMFNSGSGQPYDHWTICSPALPATLLLHFDGADGSTVINDSSSFARVLSGNANCYISTAQSKFGGSSLRVRQVNSGGVAVAAHADFARTNNEPWTVEFWVYRSDGVSGQLNAIFDWREIGVAYENLSILRSGGSEYLQYDNNAFGEQEPSPVAITSGTWHHIAVTYDGTTVTRWKNGAVDFTLVTGRSAMTTSQINIGGTFVGSVGASDATDFFIDEFRLVIGQAVYTAPFTPPTAPFA